jgi:hypothetical protein
MALILAVDYDNGIGRMRKKAVWTPSTVLDWWFLWGIGPMRERGKKRSHGGVAVRHGLFEENVIQRGDLRGGGNGEARLRACG